MSWQPHDDFDPHAELDVLVVWRQLWFLDVLMASGVQARRVYAWMHDVEPPGAFNEQRLALLTKVIFVSQFHAALYRNFFRGSNARRRQWD